MRVTSEFKSLTIHIESEEEYKWLTRLVEYGADEMVRFLTHRKPFLEIPTFFMECIRFSQILQKAIETKGINK